MGRDPTAEELWTCNDCSSPLVVDTKEAEKVCPACGLTDRCVDYEPDPHWQHTSGTLETSSPGPPRYKKLSSLDKWLSKLPPGLLVQNQRQRIRRIFLTLEQLYPKYKGKRKSFLSYSFVVEKLVYYTTGQRLGDNWKRITSPNRINEYNVIWDGMMKELPGQ